MIARQITRTRPIPAWPDAPATVDPDKAHPRAAEMAEALREGVSTFTDLLGRGFSGSEIVEHFPDAKALATKLSSRQVFPGADLVPEMVAKAKAAIVNQPPMPAGTRDTQVLFLAWGRYCAARNAFLVDPWDSQRERCADLLRAFFRLTPLQPGLVDRVVRAAVASMETRH